MGFLRKTLIVGTGGLARVAINPNSKKARIMRASERQFNVESVLAGQEIAHQRAVLAELQRQTEALRAAQQGTAGSQPAVRPPGWYKDPSGHFPKRWWDGTDWTDRVVDPSGEWHDPL